MIHVRHDQYSLVLKKNVDLRITCVIEDLVFNAVALCSSIDFGWAKWADDARTGANSFLQFLLIGSKIGDGSVLDIG